MFGAVLECEKLVSFDVAHHIGDVVKALCFTCKENVKNTKRQKDLEPDYQAPNLK